MRHAHADGSPEAVDAGGVDDVTVIGLEQQRQESANAEINPAPADIESTFPLLARVGHDAAPTADAGIVEKQVDLVGLLLLDQLVAETLVMILDRDVGDVGSDAKALRQLFRLA